jgi:hypothetical protein
METIPIYVKLVFGVTTFLTIWFFYLDSRESKSTLLFLSVWLVIQALVSATGFYTVTDSMPPRFPLLIGPPLIMIATLFITAKGKSYLDNLDLKYLTILHVVRIPVEIVLFWLFIQKTIPELMTFEGRNFDILSGITAPIIFYLGFVKNVVSRNVMLAWNFICLALLFNIVVNAILSVPTPFQKFGFEQPNIGVLFFPFTWLPACIVPVVLLSHLASIRILLKRKEGRS